MNASPSASMHACFLFPFMVYPQFYLIFLLGEILNIVKVTELILFIKKKWLISF